MPPASHLPIDHALRFFVVSLDNDRSYTTLTIEPAMGDDISILSEKNGDEVESFIGPPALLWTILSRLSSLRD